MHAEIGLVKLFVGFAGLLCLLRSFSFLAPLLFMVIVVTRLSRLERALERKQDVEEQRWLEEKISYWRKWRDVMEMGVKMSTEQDITLEELIRRASKEQSHIVTKGLLFCVAGIAFLLWAFGFFG